MKRILFCLVFIVSYSSIRAQSKKISKEILSDSIKVFMKSFAMDMRLLGDASASAKWAEKQKEILQKYFLNDEIMFPNILEDDAIYRAKRPMISINRLIAMLPFACWQGFQFEMDSDLIKTNVANKKFEQVNELNCIVPLTFWGIKANTRKAHRIGEYLNISMVVIKKRDINTFLIKEVSFTQRWIFDEPLDEKILQDIENKVVVNINTLINVQKGAKQKKGAYQKLKSFIKQDTIFLCQTDKVVRAFSINECERSKYLEIFRNNKAKVKVKSFDLSYVTDIHLTENGQYIGLRSSLEKVSLASPDSTQWIASRKNDYVIVPDSIARSQLSYWQLSNVFIQILIKQK